MVKEYFILNSKINLLKIEIKQTYIIIYIKVAKQFVQYYKYLLNYLYKIRPSTSTAKVYNKYYKIIILNYPICL